MTPVLLAALPAAAGILGAAIAVSRKLSASFISLLQHFAAGVVFAVVAVELLPDIIHSGARLPAGLGFVAGTALMLMLRIFAQRLEGKGSRGADAAAASGASTGMVVGTAIDLAIDGLLIGVAYSAGSKQGMLVTIALTVELVALGAALAAEFVDNSWSRTKAVGVIALMGLLLPLGTLVGWLLLGTASPRTLVVTLAFGASALLFLAVEELLVEAHEAPETATATAMFFAGFIAVFFLEWT